MNSETLFNQAEKQLAKSPGALQDFRKEYLAKFKESGIILDPEAYKFTRLNSFLETYELTEAGPVSVSTQQFIDANFINFIFIDGVLKNTPEAAPGLKISNIEDSLEFLTTPLDQNKSLSSLHHSLLNSGIVLEIEKKAVIGKPIKLTHFQSGSSLQAPTHIIKVGALAEVTIIEEYINGEAGCFSISETYLQVSDGAQVEHVQLLHANDKTITHSTTKADVATNANYKNFVIHLSGKLNRSNLNLSLNAAGANGESYNLYLTNGTEHSDINTVIEHRSADTTSNQIAKGILDGSSKGIFTGKIHIFPQAQRVASGQINKNLLLSNKAQIHSQPQLEIFADDVKCAHGSTTGQLSDDEVFYFQARGIPADKARTLLAHGFGLEIVVKIKNKETQKFIENKVMAALETKFELGGHK